MHVDGKQKWVWRTHLAGKYVPRLCREWAAALRACAPVDSVSDETLSAAWEVQLLAAVGSRALQAHVLKTQTCLASYVCEWAGMPSRLDPMKRPSSAGPSGGVRKRPSGGRAL